MATNENLIPIPGRLHSVATEGHVAGADEIFDDSLNKDQATINQEVNEAIGTGGSVDSRIAAAINALDSSKSQSAGADGLALNIVEENGKITSISGSIASGTYDAAGSASAAQSAAISAAATDATTKVNAAKAELKGNATSACDTLGEAEALISAESSRAQAAEADRYTKSETYTKTEVNGLVDTPHQEYVTVDAYASLPETGSKDTIYRVSNYNGSTSQVDASVYSEYAWNGTQYIFLCVKSQIGEVFDISVYNNNAKYADLAAALNGGANIPQSLQKGGMSVKFVQNSDNKYVQCRYMSSSTAVADFTNVANWQGVDDEPTASSENLVKSGGVIKSTSTLRNIKSYTQNAQKAIDCIVGVKVWVKNANMVDCGISTFGVYGSAVLLGIYTTGGTQLGNFYILDTSSYPTSGIVKYEGYPAGTNQNFYIEVTIDWSRFVYANRFNGTTPLVAFMKVETYDSDSFYLKQNSIKSKITTIEDNISTLGNNIELLAAADERFETNFGLRNTSAITDAGLKNIISCIVSIKCWMKSSLITDNVGLSAFGVYSSKFVIYVHNGTQSLGTFTVINSSTYPSTGIVTYKGYCGSYDNYYLEITIDWSKYNGSKFAQTSPQLMLSDVEDYDSNSFFIATKSISNDIIKDIDNLEDSVYGSSKIYTFVVDPNGDGDYTSLRECVDHCNTLWNVSSDQKGPKFIIKLMPATYNIRSYYTNEEWAAQGFIGLSLPRNCQIIGLGNNRSETLITCTAEEQVANISALNFNDDTYMENLTVYGENGRYTIHDDYSYYPYATKNYNHRGIKNVDFIGKNNAYSTVYGAGDAGGARWEFEDCRFINLTHRSCFSVHDRNNSEQEVADEYVFKNCQFIGYPAGAGYKQNIDFAPLISGSKNRALLIGCSFNSIRIFLDSTGSTSTSSIDVRGWGNSRNYEVVYSNDAAKTMTPKFSDETLEGYNTGNEAIAWGDYVIVDGNHALAKGTSENYTGIAISDIAVDAYGTIKLKD